MSQGSPQLEPVIRKMIVCQSWHIDASGSNLVSIDGLVWAINGLDDPPYPLLYRQLCVLVFLTEGYGSGLATVDCVFEETGEQVFSPIGGLIRFGVDPLEVVGVPFRVSDIFFDRPGMYAVRFAYNGTVLAEEPLLLR